MLVLERRDRVGGAAITEELRPGFWFTTFSYALSLLRPDIVQELDLVKHGFMPLLMSSTFCPMENGDYLYLGQDHGENQQEIPRHSRQDADAYDRFDHDLGKVLQAFKPLMDEAPPNLFSDDPEELLALAGLGARFKALPKDVLHNAVRLLTGSAADFLDDYFESDIIKGYMASSSIIGTKVGPRSQGSGLVLLYHLLGEHDGIMGAWSFHKGGNGGFTKVLARAAESFGAEIRLESPVASVITKDGRVTGVALQDGGEYHAPIVVSALDPRRTFMELVDPRELPGDLVDAIRRYRFQGTSAKVNFALDALPEYPALAGPRGPVPRVHQHRPVAGLPGAGLRRGQVRLVQHPARTSTARSRARSTRTWRLPASTSCRASSSGSRTSCARATGTSERQNLGDTVQATLESFFPGFGKLVLQREVVTPKDIEQVAGPHRGEHLPRRAAGAPDVHVPARAGLRDYRTPIEGYYQCGSGTHPGGCVSGAPGKLASKAILKDRDKAEAGRAQGLASRRRAAPALARAFRAHREVVVPQQARRGGAPGPPGLREPRRAPPVTAARQPARLGHGLGERDVVLGPRVRPAAGP